MEYREKIINEFMQQFMQKDCKDIKIDNIAENLGISKRTIYEIFSSKDEIIKQSLYYCQKLSQKKLLVLWKNETNPLKRILKTSFAIIEDTNQISITRLMNLKKQYPEIAKMLLTSHLEFMKDFMLNSYSQAQQEGLVFADIEPEFMLALIISGEKDPKQKTFNFMGKEFELMKLFAAHVFTVIRGVSTLKGVKICDEYYKKYYKNKEFLK